MGCTIKIQAAIWLHNHSRSRARGAFATTISTRSQCDTASSTRNSHRPSPTTNFRVLVSKRTLVKCSGSSAWQQIAGTLGHRTTWVLSTTGGWAWKGTRSLHFCGRLVRQRAVWTTHSGRSGGLMASPRRARGGALHGREHARRRSLNCQASAFVKIAAPGTWKVPSTGPHRGSTSRCGLAGRIMPHSLNGAPARISATCALGRAKCSAYSL